MGEVELTQDQLALVRSWRRMQDKIISFERNANRPLFEHVYGNEDGGRLIRDYVVKCERDFEKFLSYLTTEQRNKTFEYILKRFQ